MQETQGEGLQRGLKQRHVIMISLGGVIGVGMFLGSGSTVKAAGPAVVVSYALGGIIMMVVMMALAEMSVAKPVSGSFRVYAGEALGPMWGYVTGWLYWVAWTVVMACEVTASAIYLQWWFPGIPLWISSLVMSIALTAVNTVSVGNFGEFEFWFASIKVVAIIVFIIIGTMLIFGLFPGHPAVGFSNYTGIGGFFPKGFGGVLSAMLMVMFAYGGTEVIGVTAAETEDPEKNVPIAINGTIWRTLIFYIGAMLVLVGLFPWPEVGLKGSPFVIVFAKIGVPYADHIMNFVVLTAALSSMNCGMYTVSRMLYSLAEQGFAPEMFTRLNKGKVPQNALFASTFFLWITIWLAYAYPDSVFLYVTGVAGAGFQVVWLIIVLSEIKLRPKWEKENPELLRYKVPLFPISSYVAAAMIIGILLSLFVIPGQLSGILVTLGFVALFIIMYYAFGKRQMEAFAQRHGGRK